MPGHYRNAEIARGVQARSAIEDCDARYVVDSGFAISIALGLDLTAERLRA